MLNFLRTKLTAALALLLVSVMLLAGCDLAGSSGTARPDGPSDGKQTVAAEKTEAPTKPEADPDTDDGEPHTKPVTDPETVPDGEETLAPSDAAEEVPALTMPALKPADMPAFAGNPFVPLNGNIPYFTTNQITADSYEYYSPLDDLGRCGITVASIGKDMMPTSDRESISSVKPSGWQSTRYDAEIVSGGYLYNRAHLIGFQLCGENANDKNLITGTRYLNIDGMLPFENLVADYVKETGNHVLYRVTPIYTGNNLVAEGVVMEGWSVEDEGDGVCFCVYAYNVQPGIDIDYATGESRLSDGEWETQAPTEKNYVLNTKTKKFHNTWCGSVADMSEDNKDEFFGFRSELIEQGYAPCGSCNP